jgi:RNA polymerase sigma factor (sigma-70 family)
MLFARDIKKTPSPNVIEVGADLLYELNEAAMTGTPAGLDERIGNALSHFEAPLLRYARRLLSDAEQARDVVQDTFLRLCSEDPARVDGHLAQWLFTVCRNRALDLQRREGRLRPLDETALSEQPSPEPTPSRRLEGRETLDEVLAVLETLPASQREVLHLKFQDHLSYQEIAAVTGLSVNHVGVLVHNGLKAIRTRLGREAGPDKLRRVR